MEFKKINAIIRTNLLEKVERRLQKIGIDGITVSCVKGYGEYANFFTRDWLTTNARIEIFAAKDEVDSIVAAIAESAHTGLAGDGFVAVLPVETIFIIRTQSKCESKDFCREKQS
jgi:nitrogen regulatory protein P-II 1